jgi:hypothetical protein
MTVSVVPVVGGKWSKKRPGNPEGLRRTYVRRHGW